MFVCKSFCRYMFMYLFKKGLGLKFLVIYVYVNFIRSYQIVFQSYCIISHSCQKCMEVLISLHPYQYLSLSRFIILPILLGVKWYLIVVLVCISLMTNDVYLLSCSYWPFVYFPQATYHVFDL